MQSDLDSELVDLDAAVAGIGGFEVVEGIVAWRLVVSAGRVRRERLLNLRCLVGQLQGLVVVATA